MKTTIAFVIVSCEKYSDLWGTMVDSISKHWPEITENLYILSDKPAPSAVPLVVSNENLSWSDNLLFLLGRFEYSHTHVFLMMEDGPFIKRVNDERIKNIFNLFFESNGSFLTLLNEPAATSKGNCFFGPIGRDSPYRPTATFALWEISALKRVLRAGETAWEFEKKGARRVEGEDGYFSCFKSELSCLHVVVKGKLVRGVRAKLKEHGLALETTRAELSLLETIFGALYHHTRKLIFILTPTEWRKRLVRV
jgi:hypothetical protein